MDNKELNGKRLKHFKIETFDGGAYFTFLTMAEDHKKALKSLQTNSTDYKNIVHSNRNLTIKITKV